MAIVGIYGEDKSGKSSLALTFPKPLKYFELDLGGYDRAVVRFRKEQTNNLITTEHFVTPIQGDILESEDMAKVTIRQSKIITGVKELWYKFLISYFKFLKGETTTGVIDTATLLWELICNGYLQEKQEQQLDGNGNLKQGERLRVILQPPEYREPNTRMRGLMYQAKAHGKNLILTHHAKDQYRPMLNQKTGNIEDTRTGIRERSGFASLGDSTDLMLHTYSQDGKFYCRVEKESVPPALVGMTFEDPSYDGIMDAIAMICGR